MAICAWIDGDLERTVRVNHIQLGIELLECTIFSWATDCQKEVLGPLAGNGTVVHRFEFMQVVFMSSYITEPEDTFKDFSP